MSFSSSLRSNLRSIRKSLPSTVLEQAAFFVKQYVSCQKWYLLARHIGFYWPVNGEISLNPLLQLSLSLGKKCYLPVCKEPEGSLVFLPYCSKDPLLENRYKIPEPVLGSCNKPIALQQLDIVFVPLLAFDQDRNRLGSGKGFYDKTFGILQGKVLRPQLIGLAYHFQEVPSLIANSWDVKMNKIVVFNTESQIVTVI